ncbi:MAG: hypothetical protein K6G24_02535 [Lachnospiraceae bacterium]|jgi:hypothetical protein|nr:hypothetical protein [Lachnospiraceae bacterium]
MDEKKIKSAEKKIHILFGLRVTMWLICASGFIYWIYWSFKLYEIEEFELHTYATHFRPYFNTGITISIISITISIVFRIISDSIKRTMKEEMYKVR